MGAAENYLEKCADIKVDIEALGALDRARRRRSLCKVHLEVLDEREQQYFPVLTQARKKDHLVANRRRWLEHQGQRVAMQERWQKPRRAPTEPCKRPCLSKARHQLEKKQAVGCCWNTGEGETLLSQTWPRKC